MHSIKTIESMKTVTNLKFACIVNVIIVLQNLHICEAKFANPEK